MIILRNILILLFFLFLLGCSSTGTKNGTGNPPPSPPPNGQTEPLPPQSETFNDKLLTATQSGNIQQIKTLLKRKMWILMQKLKME